MPAAITGKLPSGSAEADLDRAMDRYAQGDDSAFSVVYAGLYPRLRLFLLRLCRTQALADDLLQEAFLRVHRAR